MTSIGSRRRVGRLPGLVALRRGRGRSGSLEKGEGEQHLIDLIHRQLSVRVDGAGHRGVGGTRRDVDLVPGSSHVERVRALAAAGLGPHGVAGGLELGGREEGREDVELDELDLLFVGEGVEGAGLEGGEGGVGGGEEGEPLLRAVELSVDLVRHLGVL